MELRQALLEAAQKIKALRAENDELRARDREPIAIVSMACRLPGGIQNPEDYWRLLDEGRDAIETVPKERWDAESLYDPDPDALGKSYSKQGGFLHGIDQFDPEFFGIAPREAQSMDPQQRLVLETAWELLERAGVQPGQLGQTLTGVYIGALSSDYHPLSGGREALESLDGYAATGQSTSVISGRLAYTLGLQGPAMTVDTACSSSLVALHLACQALLHRECDLALCGGVQVMLTPATFVEFSRLRAMAPDGRCKSFSAQADGAGWAEGCGLLLLKRLSDAQRDGDCILALVRGTAVNQDGKSQGLTAPHGPSQERVIRTALQRCALSAADIDLIEAHGTGTQLGDPIEAGALSAVFGPGRSAEQPVHLGSSKSNLGHAQAAAGIAGVIKIVLALGHQKMPQTLHCQPPSPHIDWPHSGLSLLSQGRAWPRGARVRRAGVSSFGVSGTNAHVIVQEAPPPRAYPAAPLQPPCGLWPLQLSARTAAALQAQAAQILEVLGRQPPPELGDLAYSLGTTRTAFAQRAVVVAADGPQAVCGLKALAAAEPVEPGVQGQATVEGKVVFVYPGQGSQWPQMAQELLHSSELFRQQLQLCDEALAPHLSWSVLAVLRGEPGCPSLERVAVVQPVLFSMAVALTALWRSFGVVPQAVVGHSQGEIVAAYVAGALTLQQAARVVALRSQALTQLEGQGAMAAVELSEQQLMPRLERFGDKLSLAAVNGPRSSLVSGRPEAVDELLQELGADHVFAKKVQVSYASHSTQVELIGPQLRQQLADLQSRPADLPLYSTVSGKQLGPEPLGAAYWYQNLRQPVRFHEAVEQLLTDGYRFFVEVSPHPVLAVALHSTLEENKHDAAVVGTLRRSQGHLGTLLRAVAELHCRGLAVDFGPSLPAGLPVPLPTYPFQRQRYWLPEAVARGKDVTAAGLSWVQHPLLGACTELADTQGHLFTARLKLGEQPWLADHRVYDTVLFPGTGFVELALAAGRELGMTTLSELTLVAPLGLSDPAGVRVQLRVEGATAQGPRALSIYSRAEAADPGDWTCHASGSLAPGDRAEPPQELGPWPPPGAQLVPLGDLYQRLAAMGLGYGPTFQGLRQLWTRGQELYARVALPADCAAQAGAFGLHPALLDAAVQSAALQPQSLQHGVQMPFEFRDVRLWAQGATELLVRLTPAGEGGSLGLQLFDVQGHRVAQIGELRVRPARAEQVQAAGTPTPAHLYQVQWQPVPAAPRDAPAVRAVVLGSGGLAERLGMPRWTDLQRGLESMGPGEAGPAQVLVDATAEPVQELLPAVHQGAHRALALLQAWGLQQRLRHSELVWVTQGAIAASVDEGVSGLDQAALWGLVRSARSEQPDRGLRLLDVEASSPGEQIRAALQVPDEPELALRQGGIWAPRLTAVTRNQESLSTLEATKNWAAGTVLITGGTGELGSLVARHLIRQHGARHLLLTSRRGLQTAGARELQAELQSLGAQVNITACDVNQRREVAALLQAIPEQAPLRAVFHCAAELQDGTLATQSAQGLDRALAAKVDGAVHLHELTRDKGLDSFILFSSLAGVLGSAGQANYAAANTFVDALAAHRKQCGLAGQSLAWGLWEPGGQSRTAQLSATDLLRMKRQGVAALSPEQGLQLLDVALRRAEAALVPARLDVSPLQREGVTVPAMLRGLVASPRLRRAAAGKADAGASKLRTRLALLPPEERQAAVLELVRSEAAAVLCFPTGAAVAPDQLLKNLGMDSLMAVELRKRLSAQTELVLPATLAFDCPTPQDIAALLLSRGLAELSRPQPDGGSATALPRPPLTAGGMQERSPTAEERRVTPPARYVSGPRNEALFVRGKAYYSSDLEQSAPAAHPMCRPGSAVAFQVGDGSAPQLVLLQEVDPSTYVPEAAAHCMQAIRRDFAERHGLFVHTICLLAASGLARTPSGKVQRRASRASFLAGSLEVIARSEQEERSGTAVPASEQPARRHAENLTRWLITRVAALSGLPEEQLTLEEPLVLYGLGSLTIATLSNELAEHLDLRVTPALLYQYPTVSALVSHLSSPAAAHLVRPANARGHRAGGEPIAIVGMSGCFPGANNIDEFWQLLCEGRDSITVIPTERFDVTAFYDSDPQVPGKMATRWAGTLDDIAGFDARFFGISPREAERMDPQQRLLLESVWSALEDAGHVPALLRGRNVGVFVGATGLEYALGHYNDLANIDVYSGTGMALSIMANRISYMLDLRGPSMTVDTACSSALSALHLAVQSLRSGESSLAIVGAANVILSPAGFISLSKAGVLASDGHCKPFADLADGFVRSEGVAALVLKPLSRALAEGDHIRAVILGTAVGQDGRTNGIMAPSGEAQEALLEAAYADAGVALRDVQYVEGQGTGAPASDIVEASALLAVLKRSQAPEIPLRLGSVKSNIGHLESASGLAGVIKTTLALHNGLIPASLHVGTPSSRIPFDDRLLSVQRQLEAWPAAARPRRAGVSAFGIGGALAHTVLEGPPPTAPPAGVHVQTWILPISARSPAALSELAAAYMQKLGSGFADQPAALRDLCYSAAVRRTHHPYRLAVVGNTATELVEQIKNRLAEPRGSAPPGSGLVWVFSDQAAVPDPALLRQLDAWEPVFAAALRRCETLLRHHCNVSVMQVLRDDGSLARPEVALPVQFAVQTALATLWQSWGVTPAAVLGHGGGQIVAAHVGGALSLDTAIELIGLRARLMDEGRLAKDATLPSGQLPLVAAELGEALESRLTHPLAMPMLSTVSGSIHAKGESLDRDSWAQFLCGPANAAAALTSALSAGYCTFLELGPSPTLAAQLEQLLRERGVAGLYIGSLQDAQPPRMQLLHGLRVLYESGRAIEFSGVFTESCQFRELPRYPWQHERFWYAPALPAGVSYQETSRAQRQPADENPAVSTGTTPPRTVPPSRLALLALTPTERLQRLSAYLLELLAQAMRLPADQAAELHAEHSLIGQGMDSFAAMELTRHVQQEWGVELHPSDLLRSASAAQLAQRIDVILAANVYAQEEEEFLV